jgi:Secretion system C-terminal sorting domain
VMKLCYDAEPLVRTNYPNLVGNVYWQADWNMGVTEVGSSGSPLFNSAGKVIGHLKGGYSFCGSGQMKDYYGCFDASWPGSGSPSSRLLDWLDPINSLAAGHYGVNGPVQLCTTGSYNIGNLPTGAVVTWQQPSPAGFASLSVSGNTATLTRLADGVVTLSAQIRLCGNTVTVSSYNIQVGAYPMEIVPTQTSCSDVLFTATGNAPIANYSWTVGSGDLLLQGGVTTAVTTVPYVGASGTYGTVALNTANFCNAGANVYADYFPYRREFMYGMYQPILNGESLVASIAPANYVSEYRWYLNGQLVQAGNSTFYMTNDFNLILCGSNQLKVEGVTDCGVTEIAFDPDVVRACGNTFRNGLSAALYPNPANDQVRVDLKTVGEKGKVPQQIQRVNVYDKLGLLKKQLVVKGMQQSVLLPVYDLPEGVYFVELISGGGQSVKQSFIIKR